LCIEYVTEICRKITIFSFTYLLTYLLTPWSRVLLDKVTGFQLVKKFLAFYGTRRFITALTSACHLSLSLGSLNQPMPQSHYLKIHFNIILLLRPGLPSGLFPSGFSSKVLYAPLPSPILPTCPHLPHFS